MLPEIPLLLAAPTTKGVELPTLIVTDPPGPAPELVLVMEPFTCKLVGLEAEPADKFMLAALAVTLPMETLPKALVPAENEPLLILPPD